MANKSLAPSRGPARDADETIDDLAAQCDPSARAIVRCIRMLAEEANSLNMPLTRDALTRAMRACAAESPAASSPGPQQIAPPGTIMH